MSFLFKKDKDKDKKQQAKPDALPSATRGLTSSDGQNLPPTNSLNILRDQERSKLSQPPLVAATPNGPSNGPGAGTAAFMPPRGQTPDQSNAKLVDSAMIPRNASASARPPVDLALYPWAQRRLDFASPQDNPFPRYGAAANSKASPTGEIYLMGGLINGSMVKGDLWVVESGSSQLSCRSLQTTAEGPGPRVGHASLLVGNAFIVFGGDTKVEDMDTLDDTLYLLNTTTRAWSRSLPQVPRPAGRYGHTLNLLNHKIYIFGGQVEGFFFNDLVAFDLNALQKPTNRWEILIQNTLDGGPPQGQSPPARTNHSVVSWNEKLYLFGGTDGENWFNDVWMYEHRTNSWAPQECIGYIPQAREGHAAALVGDVMYVFGGRTEEGRDLGDLAAFRIPTRRWYTFQNMGPSPSPRSGHGMTAHEEKIYILGGEPSSAPRDPGELSLTYILDTTKIRYPGEPPSAPAAANGQRSLQGSGRPSIGERSETPNARSMSRNGLEAPAPNGIGRSYQDDSQDSVTNQSNHQPFQRDPEISSSGLFSQGPLAATRQTRGPAAPPPSGPPPGPPPQQPGQSPSQRMMNAPIPPVMNGGRPPYATPSGRESPRPQNRMIGSESNTSMEATRSPMTQRNPEDFSREVSNVQAAVPGSFSQSAQYPQPQPPQPVHDAQAVDRGANSSAMGMSGIRPGKQQEFNDSIQRTPTEERQLPIENFDNKTTMPGQFPVDSGVGSSPSLVHRQPNDEMLRELEKIRSKNSWYESELALAKQAGYRTSNADAAADDFSPDTFREEDGPQMELFMKIRNELQHTQESFSVQLSQVAERNAQLEKQRDNAISDAAFLRTRLEGKQPDQYEDRAFDTEDTSRRLASALLVQEQASAKIRALTAEIEAERKARQLAEESADAAHSRASELDQHKQESSSELERVRTELYEAERLARAESANAAEAINSSKMHELDKNDLSKNLALAQEQAQTHATTLVSLHEATSASSEKAIVMERRLEQEKRSRDNIEDKLNKLKAEHEARVSELESTTRRLQEAEELSATHAAEARTHREVVLAGFGRESEREVKDTSAIDERVTVLQQRLEVANNMVRKNQEAADHATERLRRAEERIAGLEAYQEQASREGLNMRKQLQSSSRDASSFHSQKADLQQQLSSHKMDLTALQVQHSTLKDLLHERGVDPNDLQQSRGLGDSEERLRDLEQQLDASMRAHEDMRFSFEQRENEANRGWEEKLTALDNDYQSAVKYLKGTEKMLRHLEQELNRCKSRNKELEHELAQAREGGTTSSSWEQQRLELQTQISDLQSRVQHSGEEIERNMEELRTANMERDQAHQELNKANEVSRFNIEGLRSQNAALETRASEAERKVQLLLETVETSVSNYRHSQQIGPNGGPHFDASQSHGHNRGLSATSVGEESVYSGADGEGNAHDSDLVSRNSMALDSLANELETLRTHWETTSKTYRSSGQSMVEPKTPIIASASGEHVGPGLNDSLASWRRKLEREDRERERSRSASLQPGSRTAEQ